MIDWRDATNEDALAAWERGESVWSCELGGLGPGYEQCIQIMGFEMLRAMLALPFDWTDEPEENKNAYREYIDAIDKTPSVADVIHQLRPSGAQHGAAVNIASVFARHGYAKGMEMVPQDRRIQVRKYFPNIAAAAGGPTPRGHITE